SARLRVPDELVQLHLQAGLKAGLQQPFCQLRWRNGRRLAVRGQAEDGTEQQRKSAVQVISPNRLHRPIEIRLRSDDELNLVGRFEEIEVGPAITGRFAAIGTF